jgi:trimeric autotransporter adhesin
MWMKASTGSSYRRVVIPVALALCTLQLSCGGSSNTTASSIGPPALSAITVEPTSPTMPGGAQLQFTALGTVSGATVVVTSEVMWTSSNPGVATINSSGLATGQAVGKTQITASLSSIVGTSTLSVTGGSANLQAITVTPADSYLTVSASLQLEAVGSYSDGATGNVASSVIWSSSAPDVATVSQSGVVTAGAATGSTVIAAAVGTVSGSTTVTVVQ